MAKIIRLTESDVKRLIRKVILEQQSDTTCFDRPGFQRMETQRNAGPTVYWQKFNPQSRDIWIYFEKERQNKDGKTYNGGIRGKMDKIFMWACNNGKLSIQWVR